MPVFPFSFACPISEAKFSDELASFHVFSKILDSPSYNLQIVLYIYLCGRKTLFDLVVVSS
jgi:hypothetical protein